jgi:hypothetical protein
MTKIFNHDIKIVSLDIANDTRSTFKDKLLAIPYLLYEVERLKNGDKILINKPGGKRKYGRLSQDDFIVFIYSEYEKSLWLISHPEILNDLKEKYEIDPESTKKLIIGLYEVYLGLEPDCIIKEREVNINKGLSQETIYKVYKWIWGQEDCNYPNYPKEKGRDMSMNEILDHFKLNGAMEIRKQYI